MPRSRGSEMQQQRNSPRVPFHLKTSSSSESNFIRSPKIEDRRSPHSPLNERKKGARVADLETKLIQSQEEIEKLKEQLLSAEKVRIDAINELEETKKLFLNSVLKTDPLDPINEEKEKTINMEEVKIVPSQVPVQKNELLSLEKSKLEEKIAGEKTEANLLFHEEKIKEESESLETPQITELKNKLDFLASENQTLIKEAEKIKLDSSKWREKAEEMKTKLTETEEELNNMKITAVCLREKLESEEFSKASIETEMKRLRVQTEQWRKAAEAAASALMAGDGEFNERMEKNFRCYDVAIEGGEGKKRGSGGGIWVFGEIWKKKNLLK